MAAFPEPRAHLKNGFGTTYHVCKQWRTSPTELILNGMSVIAVIISNTVAGLAVKKGGIVNSMAILLLM